MRLPVHPPESEEAERPPPRVFFLVTNTLAEGEGRIAASDQLPQI